MNKLRNFLYLNTNLIDGYLSAIDGFLYDEETQEEHSNTQKEGTIDGGIHVLKGSGKLNSTQDTGITRNVRITDSAKFQRVYDYLSSEENIPYYEMLSQETWDNINREDFIEILVTARFSKIKEWSKAARTISNLASAFEGLTDETLLDQNAKKAISVLNALENAKQSNQISCVFTFVSDPAFPMVAYLDQQYFKIPEDDFVGEFYVLCKVQRKIPKGQKIELDEIFESIKNIPMNREQKRKMPKNISNPKEFKDVINGPATVIVPIAIYQ